MGITLAECLLEDWCLNEVETISHSPLPSEGIKTKLHKNQILINS